MLNIVNKKDVYKYNKEYDKESCRGAVLLVEATIIFPIVFFVIFFIMCLGNYHFVNSYMNSIAEKNAILAANYARSEILYDIETNGIELSNLDINPYQFGVSDKVKNYMNSKIKKEAAADGNTVFSVMKPTNVKPGTSGEFVHFESSFFNPYVEVEIEYTINFLPILKMIGITSRVETVKSKVMINDSAGFIRNLDMLKDFATDFMQSEMGRSIVGKLKGKVEELTAGIKKFFDNFGGKK